jgi:Tfp pilus assembly protein PilV
MRRVGRDRRIVSSCGVPRERRPGPSSRAERGADGFALLDVVVAIALLATALVGIESVLGTELLSIGSSTSQQAAAGLLDQAMEDVRALPYQIVANGLSTSDATIASDQNISVSGTAPNQTYTFVPTSEAIPHASLSYTQAPFVPHVSTKTVNSTTFTIATYPTIVSGAPGVYRVTVIVSWRPGSLGGVSRISAQTFVYSESSGCLTDTNHPFAAPCQAFFYAQASAGSGSAITVTGTILGVDLTHVEEVLPFAASTMQIEQTSSILGSVLTSGGQIISPDGDQAGGSNKASSAADNDPGTAGGAYQTSTTSQSGGSFTLTGPGSHANSIGLTLGPSDAGTTTSTASASSSQGCSDLGGYVQATSLPCGSGSVTQSGSAPDLLQTGFFAGSIPLLEAPLVSAAPAPSATASFAGRYTSPTPSYCPNMVIPYGDGCVHAGARRSLGSLELAGLPGQLLAGAGLDGAAPAGWGNTVSPNPNCPTGNYMVALANYSDQVGAESGMNANTATATVPTGSAQPYVCFWNGTGYTSQAVTLGSTPQPITIPTLSVVDSVVPSGAVTVTVAASLDFGTMTTTTTTPNGCVTPCKSAATIMSPLLGSISYQVTQGATTIANLTISVNLGELTVGTSYQAAPASS